MLDRPSRLIPASGYLQFQQDRLSRIAQQRFGQVQQQQVQAYADQKLQELEMQRHTEGPGITDIPVLGGIIGGTGTALGAALDVLGRPAQAVAGAALAVQAGTNPLEGALQAFTLSQDQRQDLNFATLLERAGVGNEWVRNIAGFGFGAVFDPLNALGIGAVRSAVGGVARGLGTAVRGTSLFRFGAIGDRALAYLTKVQQGVFDPPFLGKSSRVEVERALQAGGAASAVGKNFYEQMRKFSATKRIGDQLAAKEVLDGLRDEFVRTGVASGMTVEAANKASSDLVRQAVQQSDASGDLFKFLDQFNVAGQTADDAVRASQNSVQFTTAKYLKARYGLDRDTGKWGDITALKQAAFGITPTESLYFHRYMDPGAKLLGWVRSDPALRKQFSPSTIARKGVDTGEALKIFEPETNVLAAVSQDISSARLGTAVNAIVSDESLRSLLGRKATLNGSQVFDARAQLRGMGVDVAAWQDQTTQTLFDPKLIDQFVAQVPDPAVAKLARRYLESIPWKNEDLYGRQPARLILSEKQVQSAVDAIDGTGTEEAKKIQSFFKVQDLWVMPEPVARALNTVTDSRKLPAFLGMIDALTSLWKPTVTVIWPGFHIRNIGGLATLQWQMGMNPVTDIPFWNASAAAVLGRRALGVARHVEETGEGLRVRIPLPGGKTQTFAPSELERIMAERNVIGPARELEQTAAEMAGQTPSGVAGMLVRTRQRVFGQTPTQAVSGLDTMKGLLRAYSTPIHQRFAAGPATPIVAPFRYMASFGEAADNTAKAGAFMWRLSKGDTFDDAAAKVRSGLFSYVESGAGVNELAAVFPFIRWLRWNLPRQVEALLTQPQKASKFAMLRGPSLESQDLQDEASSLPDWVLERFNVILGKNEDGSIRVLSGLGLPIEDLNKLFFKSPLKTIENTLLEAVSPILRAPIEMAANHSFFTGEPIDDPSFSNYYARAWGWTENLPGLREWLGIERVTDPRTGRIRWRSNNPVNNFVLVSMIGRFGRTLDQAGNLAIQPRDTAGEMFNMLSGVRTSDVFRPAPADIPFKNQIAQDPYLGELYRRYTAIPLYPNLSPDQSMVAAQAMANIQSRAGLLQKFNDEIGDEQAFQLAANLLGQFDPKGVALARLVRRMGWKQTGRKARTLFQKTYPDLAVAMQDLPPSTRDILEGMAREAG